jgi:hypothetical protein
LNYLDVCISDTHLFFYVDTSINGFRWEGLLVLSPLTWVVD